MNFFHGSSTPLPPGTILRNLPGYEERWGHNDFYKILEQYRPQDKLPHKEAVFLCENDDDLDAVGAGTEFVLEVLPMGPVSRHDLNWGSEIDVLRSNGVPADDPQIALAAENYWNGVPHHDPVWEVLTAEGRVMSCEPF